MIVLQAKITGQQGSAHKGLLQKGHESMMAYAPQLFFIEFDILYGQIMRREVSNKYEKDTNCNMNEHSFFNS